MTIWQQLGGKVYTGENLTDDQIGRFLAIGGKWICPWVYQDLNADKNLALIPHWRSLGITVGGVFNCFGGDPVTDATNISKIAHEHDLKLVIIDAEASYQYPNPGCMLLPPLLAKMRELMPDREIGVNTNGMNDSMIWNGGTLGYARSCHNLKIRVCPQWYSAPRYAGSCWTDPVCNMSYANLQKGLDNFHDPTQKYNRAIPLSYIHFCAEPTGVEDAVLQTTLDQAVKAIPLGLTPGMNLFVLERVPPEDFKLLERYKGTLYLA